MIELSRDSFFPQIATLRKVDVVFKIASIVAISQICVIHFRPYSGRILETNYEHPKNLF